MNAGRTPARNIRNCRAQTDVMEAIADAERVIAGVAGELLALNEGCD